MSLDNTHLDSGTSGNSVSDSSKQPNSNSSQTTSNQTTSIDVPIADDGVAQSSLLSQLPIQGSTLLYGLNFKYTKVTKKGLFNRIKGNTQTLDLDISCLLFDDKLQLIDTVWFKQLRDSSEAIRHQGDSINGKDRGSAAQIDRNVDMETIELRLSRLPETVTHLALLLSSYYDYPIRQVERGNLYISDDEGSEVYTSDLTLLSHDGTAMCIAILSRELGEWRLTIKDLVLNSPNIQQMIKAIQHDLARIYAT
ncbi:TerD family protein [Psychrobacter lutiphocae]|uniref:TerD family protein n=1 Tax=Psychrobacter lutiphocae TaxID=540500 RepID=UPI000362C6EF|nr:TerD family protein [Psychrobacter lutiphocae]